MASQPFRSIRRSPSQAILMALFAALTSCGGPDDAPAYGEAARTPSSAGQVWEIARPADRTDAGAALLAYTHGLHVMIVDGDQAFAGMTRLRGNRDGDGTTFDLGDGLSATLRPAGDVMELAFSSGEKLSYNRRGDR